MLKAVGHTDCWNPDGVSRQKACLERHGSQKVCPQGSARGFFLSTLADLRQHGLVQLMSHCCHDAAFKAVGSLVTGADRPLKARTNA